MRDASTLQRSASSECGTTSEELARLLDTDSAIFDRSSFGERVLRNYSAQQIAELQEHMAEDLSQLRVKRRTLLSENYGKFLGVHEHLHSLHSSLTVIVERIEELQRQLDAELREEPPSQ